MKKALRRSFQRKSIKALKKLMKYLLNKEELILMRTASLFKTKP
jgi:hypothetical protein